VETVAAVVAMAAVETVAVAVVDITGIINLRDIHTLKDPSGNGRIFLCQGSKWIK